LEPKIQSLLETNPDVALSKNLYGINRSHTNFMMRPCKLKEYKYVSRLSVLDIATQHIGYRIGAATVEAALRAVHSMYLLLLG
jgi:hypothetical protein